MHGADFQLKKGESKKMQIAGLQRLTLLDYPGKVAATIFLATCNFRCPFCHNARLVQNPGEEEKLSAEEILGFLKKRRGVLEGVAVTGGEPLIWPETAELLREIKALGFKVKLDTNGSFPERLKGILDEGLADRIAMDIKASPENYPRATGLKSFDLAPIIKSIELIKNSGIEYEFRTTLVKGIHEPEEMHEIGRLIEGAEEYYLQAFKNSGELINAEGLEGFEEAVMREFLDIAQKYVRSVSLRGM